MKPTVLLTGASGKLGRELVRRLGKAGWTLRLTDLVATFDDELPSGATFTQADLGTDAGAVTIADLAQGCSAILHFGGVSTERPFAEIEPANIRGAVAVWEAARSAAARVVFASSNHVMGLALRTDTKLDVATAQMKPDGYYGLSKAFAELLAKMYAEKHHVPAVLLRIGSCFETPTDARMLSTWLAFDDLETLVIRAVVAPTESLFADGRGGCAVIWGTSANSRSFWGHDDRKCIAWEPICSADGFATLQLATKISGSHIAERYQGGAFAAIGWTARDEIFDTHVVRKDVPFCFLDCTRAFDGLNDQQRLYAHELAMASWEGALVCLHQTSPESPAIFSLIQRVFRSPDKAQLLFAQHAAFVEYAANFLGNMGNYLSFGDTKLIPRCTREEFLAAVEVSGGAELAKETASSGLLDSVYALMPPRLRQLGLGDHGISTYYAGDPSEADIAAVQKLLDSLGIHPCNTRLAKLPDGSFRVRIASVESSSTPVVHTLSPGGPVVSIVRGDFAFYLAKVIKHLRAARDVVPNKIEADMLDAYIAHFTTGDVAEHKRSQEIWVTDKGPVVEANIGFIESYRDPAGVRAEFEGWVAVVDAVGSKQLALLVDNAASLLPLLPWGRDFEKDAFSKPDFTAIDVLAYGCSGVPLGINLPNYNDVRQSCGFKNVALGNAMRSTSPNERLTFLSLEDEAFCR